jgi:glycosyltransferase involved in cell wall biosynthesis
MKVLMISGDKNLLKTGAEARERLAIQTAAVEQLDVFIWPQVHSVWEIMRAARKNRYDVVTTQDPFWRGLLGWKIKFWFGAKLNLQVHADLRGQSLVKRVLAHFLLRRADSIRPQSERVAAEVRKLGVKAPIHILPVFISPARVAGVPRTHHPSFAKTILWIGRFEREKDPEAALDVLRQVRETGVDAGLIMLGSGSLEGRLKRVSSGLPVEFPGWQEPVSYLAMADVVLSTSPYESYGASIVEALAAGVPVVSRDVGVAREAGAIVMSASGCAAAVIEVLRSGRRGELKLPMLSAEEWAKSWRESLV